IFVVNELMEDVILLDGVCQDMSTREVFQPPSYIPRTAHRLIFPKSSQLIVSGSCPETKLLIVPAKDIDELDIMEDEIDDLQCELVSNVSSRCLYHKVVHKLSSESRGKSALRARAKRRRRRVNYKESVWGNKMLSIGISRYFCFHTASATVAAPSLTHSEREINSKYYKPSLVDVPEKLDTSKDTQFNVRYNGSPRVAQRPSLHAQMSEEEIYNTMLSRNKKSYKRPSK
ncbi:sperm-specific sodium proton exchanger precursor, partial [Danaus plexippus plexippus]